MKSDFRARNHPAYWAFAAHRVSGVLLALFLPLHFWALGQALNGEAGLESFLRWSDQPLVKFAETVLVLLLAAHLTGGLRLLALEFLAWRDWQKRLLAGAAGLTLAAGLLFLLNAGPAAAQAYPVKPVRVIVPFPPGGAADIVARAITHEMGRAWGAQVVVDNRAGAGGLIGAEHAARAAPDGYTLLFASASPMTVSPHLALRPPYHPIRDFTPIVLIGFSPNVIVVHPSLPARSMKELIALARARPGQINYASNGVGTLSHLAMELVKHQAGINLVHVPYKGGAPAMIDTVAGQCSVFFAAYPTLSAQVKAGRLRALAVTSTRRIALAPELPTVAEAALPGFEATQWWGAYGPVGLPAALVAKLNADIGKALQSAEVKSRLAADAAEPAGGTPGDLAAYLRTDYERWGKVVKASGIRGE
jgi:succinate dehydrogenase cytochrome b556 subunit